eukprot:gene22842-29016_t
MILGGSDNISKFTIHLIPTCESDIIVDQRHCRMDIEYLSKPNDFIPFDTYRPRTTFDPRRSIAAKGELIKSLSESKADSSVEMFMAYHFMSISDASAISAFDAILKDGLAEHTLLGDLQDSDTAHMHHVRLNSPLHPARPVLADTSLQLSGSGKLGGLQRGTSLSQINTSNPSSSKLKRSATQTSKIFRENQIKETLLNAPSMRHILSVEQAFILAQESTPFSAQKMEFLQLFWDSIDLQAETKEDIVLTIETRARNLTLTSSFEQW